MLTDSVGSMLTSIRNANSAGHTSVKVPASRLKANICKVLKEEGYIRSFKILVSEDRKAFLKIHLKEGAISGLKRVSSPGMRVFSSNDTIPRVISGLGVSILSTSRGVLSSRQAVKQKVGGEIICNVW